MANVLKTPDMVIKVATDEVGYLEKKSLADLDDKTINSGYNNYTKYWRDLAPGYQGQPWCGAFENWCFIQAYGKETADYLLCGGITCAAPYYTPTTARCFQDAGRWYTKNPQAGDVIYFKQSNGVICHVGIVRKVDNAYVYTIEGNTSSGNDVVTPNGGAVATKYYSLTNTRIAGYGRPKYDNVSSIVNKFKEAIGVSTKIQVAAYFDKSLAGTYEVTASSLNMRASAGTDNNVNKILAVLPKGTRVNCYGYYNMYKGVRWFYILYGQQVGYVSSEYLKRV